MRIFLFCLLHLLILSRGYKSNYQTQSKPTEIQIPSNLQPIDCDVLDLETQTCIIISDQTNGFYYDDPMYKIEFNGVLADIRNSTNCQIYIIAKSITFEYSNITGCDIFLNGTEVLKILYSNISTDGSIYSGLGTSINNLNFGNSYAGSGGSNSNSMYFNYGYGEFNTFYNENCTVTSQSNINCTTAGSGGNQSMTEGGGRTRIITHFFTLDSSKISANGYPRNSDCKSNSNFVGNGGTGGYIFLNFSSIIPLDDKETIIAADGGMGCNNPTTTNYGGSGGRIIVESRTEINRQVFARGGHGNTTSQYGGAGTIYSVQEPNHSVIISQNKNFTIPTPTFSVSEEINKHRNFKLFILNGSTFLPYSVNGSGYINFTIEGFNLDLGILFLIQNTKMNLRSFKIYESNITSNQSFLSVNATSDIKIRGSMIKFESNSTLILISENGDINFSEQSDISSFFVYMQAPRILLNGQIFTKQQRCDDNVQVNFISPLVYQLNMTQVALNTIASDNLTELYLDYYSNIFTFMAIGNETIKCEGLDLKGSHIGLYGTNISLDRNSKISSDGLGCPSDQGIAPGISLTGCPSTGGAHGGFGGTGVNTSGTSLSCLNSTIFQQMIYDDPINPILAGSGGGSYNTNETGLQLGGSGGGVIIIGSKSHLKVDGQISANGQAAGSIMNVTSAAGSGAGGAIQLLMKYLSGIGNVSANGGNSTNLGGEGAGGRIYFNLFAWNNSFTQYDVAPNFFNAYPGSRAIFMNNSNMSGDFYLAGPGSKEISLYLWIGIKTSPCLPGYYGFFCSPCEQQMYKTDFSNSECSPCSVVSGGDIVQSSLPKQSYLCPYTCTFEFEQGGLNSCAPNILAYAWKKGLYEFFYYLSSIIAIVLLQIGYSLHRDDKQRKFLLRKTNYAFGMERENQKRLGEEEVFAKTHLQRIYLLGDNLPESKWFTNMDLINLKQISRIRTNIDHLLKNINLDTNWKKRWIWVLRVFILLYNPIYLFFLQYWRRKIYKTIVKHVQEEQIELEKINLKKRLKFKMSIQCNKDYSFAYIDIFQYDNEYSSTKLHEPLILLLSGNGTHFSPLGIDKTDMMYSFLVHDWAELNLINIENRTRYFIELFDEFVENFNARAKFINYDTTLNSFRKSVCELEKYISQECEQLAQEFGLFIQLFVFEIPRFTIEETDTTQPFLQSPIQVDLVDNSNPAFFSNFLKNLLKIHMDSYVHVRFSLLFYSDNSSTTNSILSARTRSLGDRFSVTADNISNSTKTNTKPDNNNFDEYFKNILFSDAEREVIVNEYSMPKEIANSSKRKKIAKNPVSKSTKKYFHKINKFLAFFVSLQKNSMDRSTTLVLIGISVAFDFYFLLYRFIIAEYYRSQQQSSESWVTGFILPFPFATVLSPIFGLIAMSTFNHRAIIYFSVFNLMGIFNKILDMFFNLLANYDEYNLIASASWILLSVWIQRLSNILATIEM